MRCSGLHNNPENEHNGGQADNVWKQDPHAIVLGQITSYPWKERSSHTAEAGKKADGTRHDAARKRI